MNRENLQEMANFALTIPPGKFTMNRFGSGNEVAIQCNTVCCIIGHSIVLAPELIKYDKWGGIEFGMWSEEFTGLAYESPAWKFCFSPDWSKVDNTPQGASDRIFTLLKTGLPADWRKQMRGL